MIHIYIYIYDRGNDHMIAGTKRDRMKEAGDDDDGRLSFSSSSCSRPRVRVLPQLIIVHNSPTSRRTASINASSHPHPSLVLPAHSLHSSSSCLYHPTSAITPRSLTALAPDPLRPPALTPPHPSPNPSTRTRRLLRLHLLILNRPPPHLPLKMVFITSSMVSPSYISLSQRTAKSSLPPTPKARDVGSLISVSLACLFSSRSFFLSGFGLSLSRDLPFFHQASRDIPKWKHLCL